MLATAVSKLIGRYFFFWTFLGMVLVTSGLAASPISPPILAPADPFLPRVNIEQISPTGEIGPAPGVSNTVRWVMRGDRSPVKRPFLEISLKLPVGMSLVPLPKDSEISIQNQPENLAVLDTDARFTTLQADINRPKKQPERVNLLISALVDKPIYFIDHSCSDIGIASRMVKDGGRFLYTGLFCQTSIDKINIFLLHSSDSKVLPSTSLGEPENQGTGWQLHVLLRPRDGLTQEQKVGAFAVGDPAAREFSEYELVFKPVTEAKKLKLALSLGGTYVTYKEDALGINLKETGITGKISGRYPLIARKLYANASLYGTLLPLTHSPAGIETARFYGINARLGYVLPVRTGAVEWSFLAGWYIWGMMVPHSSYGVKNLSGPQFFVSTDIQQAGHRAYNFYLKYAPISKTPAFNISTKREIAFGAGYELTPPSAKRVWKLVFDFADIKAEPFTGDTATNKISSQSFTLGVSVGI